MKISDVKPFAIHSGRDIFVVKVETDEGIYGIGEGGISGRELAMKGAVEHFKALLVGRDPFEIEDIWQTLFRGGFFPGGPILSAAISAVDIALWDIKGKALGVPVYQLLGGKCRDRVDVYVGFAELGEDTDQAVQSALQRVKEGWRYIRTAPAASGGPNRFEPVEAVENAIRGWKAVHEAVGPDIRMAIDMHTRFNPTHAVQLCRGIEPYRPFFVEDPIRSEEPAALRTVRQHTAVPLAVGEQYSSKWCFRQAIEEQLCDYARIDLCNVGGFTEARKIAGWCEVHYIDVVPHNPLGPVSTAACVHLDFAINNFAVQELGGGLGTLPEVFPQQPQLVNNAFPLPTAPGLGVTFDEERAEQYPIQMWNPPRFVRDDGAFTNW
jgi:galactonate dehydratase